MNRIAKLITTASLFVALGLPAGGAVAEQQKLLKDRVVGAWKLVSLYSERPGGPRPAEWNRQVNGMAMFDAQGRFTWQLIGEARPESASKDPRQPDALVVSYYGSYTINEADQTIAFQIERASYSQNNGAQRSGKISITGDILEYVGRARVGADGKPFVPHLEFTRVPAIPELEAQVPSGKPFVPDNW